MKYIDYKEMDEFYSIKELCKLFEMDKQTIQAYCSKLDLKPEKENGVYGFSKHRARKLHNHIYREEKYGQQTQEFSCRKEDPWND